MQIIRRSDGCRWVQECEACGCLYIYSGQDIREEDVKHDDLESLKLKLIKAPTHSVVECPECHHHNVVPRMAKYRRPVMGNFSEEDWA